MSRLAMATGLDGAWVVTGRASLCAGQIQGFRQDSGTRLLRVGAVGVHVDVDG